MDCIGLTNSLKRFQEIKFQIDSVLDTEEKAGEKLAKLLPLKREFYTIVDQIEQENGAADVAFLRAFRKKEINIGFLPNNSTSDVLNAFDEFYDLIDLEKDFMRVNKRSFERLVEYIDKNQEQITSVINNYDKHNEKAHARLLNILRLIIVSAFIRKTLKPNQKLDLRGMRNLPNIIGIRFQEGQLILDDCEDIGWEMEGGEIIAIEANTDVGECIAGGKIKVGSASSFVGSNAIGGKIIVGKAEGLVGLRANGGAITLEEGTGEIGAQSKNAIFVRKAGDSIGAGKSGGVLIVEEAGDLIGRDPSAGRGVGQGTLLVTRFTDREINKSEQVTIRYDEESCTYKEIRSGAEIDSQIIRDGNVIKIFKGFGVNLVIIDDMSIINENPTDGMHGGILVLRDLPEGELGKNMKNCAVIVEVDKDPEEVKKLIDKDRKPGEGLILMRVPDPNRSGKTMLIDLEG